MKIFIEQMPGEHATVLHVNGKKMILEPGECREVGELFLKLFIKEGLVKEILE